MICCPRCGHRWAEDSTEHVVDPVAARRERLRDSCRAKNIFVSGDDRVREHDLARLLGKSVATLRRWRSNGAIVIPYHRTQPRSYTLDDIAQYLESTREDDL